MHATYLASECIRAVMDAQRYHMVEVCIRIKRYWTVENLHATLRAVSLSAFRSMQFYETKADAGMHAAVRTICKKFKNWVIAHISGLFRLCFREVKLVPSTLRARA